MRYQLFDSVYDDEGNSKARTFFEKMRKWLDNLTNPEAIQQLKGIFLKDQLSRTCLVEGSNSSGAFNDGLLLESSGFSTALFGKSDLDSQIDEAVNGVYERPKAIAEPSYDRIYHFTEKGIKLTSHSKLDEEAYLEDVRAAEKERQPKSDLTEAEIDAMLNIERKKKVDSSINETIKEAFL